jgi:hypothetical protein
MLWEVLWGLLGSASFGYEWGQNLWMGGSGRMRHPHCGKQLGFDPCPFKLSHSCLTFRWSMYSSNGLTTIAKKDSASYPRGSWVLNSSIFKTGVGSLIQYAKVCKTKSFFKLGHISFRELAGSSLKKLHSSTLCICVFLCCTTACSSAARAHGEQQMQKVDEWISLKPPSVNAQSSSTWMSHGSIC